MKNGYVAFWRGKRIEVYAETILAARELAARALGAKRSYELAVMLAEKDGQSVTHVADF
jgi:hypothetical protein